MSEDDPRYGYGSYAWPLWNEHDRSGESIRKVLRRAGFHDFGEHNGTANTTGFVVEGGNDGKPFSVWCCDETQREAGHPELYAVALTAAGWIIRLDPGLDQVMEVCRAPAGPPASAMPLDLDLTTWLLLAAVLFGGVVLSVLAFTADLPEFARLFVLAVATVGVLAAVVGLWALRVTR
ncbi:hypothetical protein AB0M43_35930 [Longispora sp. NPDC051575]|uniref:hypothetical protein n=1 Tax=Longispora sp. NPDC051575 TaxID=3154943 RepID=UPI00341EFA86